MADNDTQPVDVMAAHTEAPSLLLSHEGEFPHQTTSTGAPSLHPPPWSLCAFCLRSPRRALHLHQGGRMQRCAAATATQAAPGGEADGGGGAGGRSAGGHVCCRECVQLEYDAERRRGAARDAGRWQEVLARELPERMQTGTGNRSGRIDTDNSKGSDANAIVGAGGLGMAVIGNINVNVNVNVNENVNGDMKGNVGGCDSVMTAGEGDEQPGCVCVKCPLCGTCVQIPSLGGVQTLKEVLCDVCEERPANTLCQDSSVWLCENDQCRQAAAFFVDKMSGILQSPLDIYTKETTELEGQNIAEAVQRCESCVKHGQNAEVAIGLARKSLARDCNKAKEQMQSRFLDIHSLLKLHQQQALQQITQIQSSTDTFLTEQTNLLDSHMQSLSMAIELKEVLCKSTDLPDFEYLGSSALQHIKSLENIEIPLAPCCRPDFSFDFNFDWSDHINSLGKISLGTSSDSSEITMSLLKNLDNVDDFALETVKLFAQGNYSQVHKNCLVMTSFSSPASEPGLTDAIANLLLNCIFSLQPNLFSAQQPFSVYPYDEYLDNAIKASPNSHQFMLKVAERASTSAEQCVSATGHFLCGFIYHWPIGVTQDTSVALQQYCMSDLHNNSLAQYYLGWCYQYGHGVHKNPEEAVRLYRLATDRGNGLAMCQLGWCFETGNGVKKDVTESYNLFHTAAEAGNAPSQYNLGLYFFLGKGGVTTNPQQGFHWYKVSSAQGYPSAQCNLAECYSTGNGTDKDVTEAVRLYELAAAQKNTGAQEALKKLRATLATIRSPTSKKGKRKHKTTAE